MTELPELFKAFGFPAGLVLLLLYAMWLGVKIIIRMVERKDKESQEREVRLVVAMDKLGTRLDVVREEQVDLLQEVIKENTLALRASADVLRELAEGNDETRGVLCGVRETMYEVRQEILGSSARRRVVKEEDRSLLGGA